jgi:hypothetical protein
MKPIVVALAIAALLASQARAANAELSIDAKRMLAYGTLAVMTGACKTSLTAEQSAEIKTGLEKAAQAQKDFSEADFTELMKAAGAQVGEHKAETCAALTPDFIATSLKEAAAGE